VETDLQLNPEKKIKVLCLVAHRIGRSPGQRFRFEQYVDFLEQHGFECTLSHLLSETEDAVFYRHHHYLQKLLIFLKTIRSRKQDVRKLDQYDIVFIYREAVMHGSVRFEKQIASRGIPIIYDFDDAIWLFDVSNGNRLFGWLKRPGKTADIIKLSRAVIVGNEFLAEYARQFSEQVVVIPTTIQTGTYRATGEQKTGETICIGWTGSSTTLKHFHLAIPVLKKIIEKYPGKIRIKLISDEPYMTNDIPVQFCKWNRETEVPDLMEIDIGIMPLPNDEWSKGKCGFKGLQYMALGIPAVMSPVGVNADIISNGQTGFLAASEEEWIEKLSLLIELPELREKLGKAGQKTVEEKYSFEANKLKWLKVFQSVTHA
jgi:glycosyltransferase involved in cell wall biosynthesis